MSTLDHPLIAFSNSPNDQFTIRNACEGVGIFGGTGSGKTSGSGAALAQSYIEQGFGGLVLTVKPDEWEDWQRWTKAAGREDDLIIFSPENPYRFDFLLYEQSQGETRTTNVVDLIDTAVEIMAESQGESRGGDEQFWKDAGSQLISKSIDLILLAQAPLTINFILDVINSAPTSEHEVAAKNGETPLCLRSLKDEKGEFAGYPTTFAKCFGAIHKRFENKELSPQDLQKAEIVSNYFMQDYALLGERTRSSVKLQLTTTLYQLLAEDTGLLLCGGHPAADEIPIY